MRYATALKASIVLILALFLPGLCMAQETDFRGWEDAPGLFFYLVQPESAWKAGLLSVEQTPVRDHVTGVSALKLSFAADILGKDVPPPSQGSFIPGPPDKVIVDMLGSIVYRPLAPVVASRAGWAGLSIWVKGDGSDGIGVMGIGDGGAMDPRVTFRLSDKTWQPVRVLWSDFDRPVPTTFIPSLFFTVTPGTRRPVSYTIDGIELIRGPGAAPGDDERRIEGEKSAKLPDTPRPADLASFVTERAKLAGVRALLAAKQPVRVLIVGDSVAQGSAAWNVPPGLRASFLFPGVLEREMKSKSPGVTVQSRFVETPEEAAGWVAAELHAFKPNLVVVEMSCSPPGPQGFGAAIRARARIKALLESCAAAKVEAIALAVPPVYDPYKRINYASLLLEESASAHVPALDFGRFAAARGKDFEGEYYSRPDALDVQGHLLAGKILSAGIMNP